MRAAWAIAIGVLWVCSAPGCGAGWSPGGPFWSRGPSEAAPSGGSGRAARPSRLSPATLAERDAVFGFVRDELGIRMPVRAEDVVPPKPAAVFGILTTDDSGLPRFVPAREIPNVEGQTYGWFVWVGNAKRPVRWTETRIRPRPPARGAPPARVAVARSPDGRTTTIRRETLPVRGFIHHTWVVGRDEPAGPVEVTVALPGGRTRRFEAKLGPPRGFDPDAVCPYVAVYIDWWSRAEQPGGDPEGRDLTERVLRRFGERLLLHGFDVVDEASETHWIVHAMASRSLQDLQVAHGHLAMRAFAEFEGRVLRTSLHTPGETVQYNFLFEQPVPQLDGYVEKLADRFAERLFPHSRRMCADWNSGQLEEEARLVRLREELSAEIERVRRERARTRQRKQLELEMEDAPVP